MPSKSKKQAKFMAACAHGADYPSCPPKSVAKEFNKHDAKTGILKKKAIKESLNDYKRLSTDMKVFDDRGTVSTLAKGTVVVRRSFKGQRFVELQARDAAGSLSGLLYASKEDYFTATADQKATDELFKSAQPAKAARIHTEPTALGKMLRGESEDHPMSFKQFLVEGEYKIHPHYDFPNQQKKIILELYKQSDYTREKFIEMMKSRGMDVMQLMQTNPAVARFLQSLKFRT
jgi:hypothetical protein